MLDRCFYAGLLGLVVIGMATAHDAEARTYVVRGEGMELAVDEQGNLTSLTNLRTGHNYAAGRPMWRLYFDRPMQKENQVLAKLNRPTIRQDGQEIVFEYESLKTEQETLHIRLSLRIRLDGDLLRFSSEVHNDEPHTIVRELHWPLVADCQMPTDHQLLTTQFGGQLYPNPKQRIIATGNSPPYMAPSQYYRQMDQKYPGQSVSNCFALVGDAQGLYLGCHDATFQDTWHGLRVYPDQQGEFNELEVGLYKYPNCLTDQSWSCDANVLAPYSGDWHETSKIYRRWADTWWRHQEPPLWVKKMKGWQRIIFRHQYGETLFRYDDLNGRIRKAGESVGVNTVFPFGWWNSGMDNGYPDSYYVTDPKQGGDAAWKKAIAAYRQSGGKVLLYFNGKLIDVESDFYRKGEGKSVCYKTNAGTEYNEAYRFKGHGTFTGYYNSRAFVVADTRNLVWRKKLLEMADRALAFGVDSVFYDQLGYCEATVNWDLSKEFPIPNTRTIADKADVLKMIHQYLDTKDKNIALGTEWFTDVVAQHVDYVHNIYGATGLYNFTDWVRYTFPEIVLSDREIRDDTDIPRRVNHSVLKGLRNDIEIYRCRDVIDKTPNYQQYLARVNALREKYADLLLVGTYRDTDGFANDNPKVPARCFVNGNRMAIVVTQSHSALAATRIAAPGWRYREVGAVGEVRVQEAADGKQHVSLPKDGLAVLVYEKAE
jgi:hypothetical protein